MDLQKIKDDKLIKQHNTITSGRYDFSACQLDIVFMLLACIKDTDDKEKVYNIRVKDIETITGRQWNYQQTSNATEDLLSRVYKINMPEGLRQLVLFSYVQYLNGTGSFDIKMNPDARQYFFELKSGYSLLELKSTLSLKGKYSKRIYALACQWRRAGGHEYELKEFKEILGLIDPKGIEPEQYDQISAFKKYVLEKAKEEINGHTDIIFDYELMKRRGRAIDYIKIYAGFTKPNLQPEIDFKVDVNLQLKLKTITGVGISEKYAQIIAEKYWKIFVDSKDKMLKDIHSGKLKTESFPAYLIGVLRKKGCEL
mgnify:CR=1 FL=1